jgi:hypothetical protein
MKSTKEAYCIWPKACNQSKNEHKKMFLSEFPFSSTLSKVLANCPHNAKGNCVQISPLVLYYLVVHRVKSYIGW